MKKNNEILNHGIDESKNSIGFKFDSGQNDKKKSK
jgi:hypothetical protein